MLLVAEGDHGVDAHGAAGGNGRGGEDDGDGKKSGGAVDEGIERAYCYERRREQAGEGGSASRAEE